MNENQSQNQSQNQTETPTLELALTQAVLPQSVLKTLHSSDSASPQPDVLVAELAPDHDQAASDLRDLLSSGAYRVKDERALIQRRTVEPATTPTPAPTTATSLECVI